MSRRRRHVSSRDGLWNWTDTRAGDIQPAEIRPNPLLVVCRVTSCGAVVGEPCVRPGRRGRVRRKAPHDTRIEDAARAAQADQEPTFPPPSAATSEPKGRS
jgi:hypothetical protein